MRCFLQLCNAFENSNPLAIWISKRGSFEKISDPAHDRILPSMNHAGIQDFARLLFVHVIRHCMNPQFSFYIELASLNRIPLDFDMKASYRQSQLKASLCGMACLASGLSWMWIAFG